MKAVIVADSHIGVTTHGTVTNVDSLIQNTRVQDSLGNLEYAVDYAIEEGADFFFHVGDVFHHKKPHPAYITAVMELLYRLEENDVQTIILVGNHDHNGLLSDHALGAFSIPFRNIDVADYPQLFNLGDCYVIALPHASPIISQPQNPTEFLVKSFQELLSQAKEDKPIFVLLHATIEGAKFGSEREVLIGNDIYLPVKLFDDPRITAVWAGHIHSHQMINDKVGYVGSLSRASFSEKDEKKGFVVIDLLEGDYQWQFIDVKDRPFLEINLDLGDSQDFMTSMREYDIERAIVKVRIKATHTQKSEFNQRALEEYLKRSFWYTIEWELQKEVQVRNPEINERLTPNSALEKYLKGKNIPKELKDSIIETGTQLMANFGLNFGESYNTGISKIEWIEFENFVTYEELNLNLDDIELAAIIGKNGSGKSTIRLGILWALYGKVEVSNDELVKNGSDYCSATIAFRSVDGNKYVVRREYERGSGTRSLALALADEEEFVELSKNTIKETQAEIERIIGVSYDLVTTVALISQNESDKFSSAKPAQAKLLLSKLIGIDIYEELEEEVKERVKLLKSEAKFLGERETTLRNAIQQLEGTPSALEAKKLEQGEVTRSSEKVESEIKTLEKELNALREKLYKIPEGLIDQLLRGIKYKEDTLAEYDMKSAKANEILSQGPKRILEINLKMEEYGKRIAKLRFEAEERASLIEKAESMAKTQQEIMTDIIHLDSTISSCEDEIVKLRAKAREVLKSEKCLTCGAPISEESKNNSVNEMKEQAEEFKQKIAACSEEKERKEQELQQTKAKLGEIQEKIDNLARSSTLIERLELEIEKLNNEAIDLDEKIREADNYLKEIDPEKIRSALEEQKKELQSIQDHIDAIPAIKEEMESKKRKLDVLSAEQKALQSKLIEISGEIGALEAKLENFNKLQEDITKNGEAWEEANRKLKIYSELSEAFSKKGIPSLIIENSLPELEDEANRILQRLSNGRQTIVLETLKENKSGTISETFEIFVLGSEGRRNFKMLSGGEAMRVSIALNAALGKILARRSGSKVAIAFWDEPAAPLDTEGKQSLVDCIHLLHRDGIFNQIFVVSHDEVLSDSFPVRLLVEKKGRSGTIIRV